MATKEQNINLWNFQDIAMAISYIIALVLVFIGTSELFYWDKDSLSYLITVQIFLYFISSFIVLYFALIRKKNSWRDFFGVSNPQMLIWIGIIVFGLMIAVTSIIDIAFEHLMNVKSSDVYQNIDTQRLKSISFVGVFFAPVAEEVFFRGFLQPVFVSKFGFWLGIILVALLFSGLHILYVSNISALVCIICVGLILSLTKEKTNSLIPVIIAHFLNNLIAVLYLYF
jgi:membrane protease YdiL (CAAX protease family)